MKDSFEEVGQGFGETYKFRYYQQGLTIFFADERMKVKNSKTFLIL
jgi:hypothetical protein